MIEFSSTAPSAAAPAARRRDPAGAEPWTITAEAEPLDDETLAALFGAARAATGREAPWLFLYGSSPEERECVRALLDDAGQRCTAGAPVLAVLLARRDPHARADHRARLDAGAAWLSLAVQARRLGLRTAVVAGFDERLAYEMLDVAPEEYQAMAVVAIGRERRRRVA